ncbi:MAG TPA: hypothetical protein VEF04_09495 [Blastocatellia bacterium]|nr:hypothetical protein [Blastocatellia bacterium]
MISVIYNPYIDTIALYQHLGGLILYTWPAECGVLHSVGWLRRYGWHFIGDL